MVEVYDPPTMSVYAEYCGWVLARAHARSGSPKLISEYLGSSDRFDESIADFAEAYADQNERDYREFVRAVRRQAAGGGGMKALGQRVCFNLA